MHSNEVRVHETYVLQIFQIAHTYSKMKIGTIGRDKI